MKGLPVGRAPVTPNPTAHEAQSRAGRLGGHARAAALTPGRRSAIAVTANEAALRALAARNAAANLLMDQRVQELASAIRGTARQGRRFNLLQHFEARGWINEAGIRRRFSATYGMTPQVFWRAALGAGAD